MAYNRTLETLMNTDPETLNRMVWSDERLVDIERRNVLGTGIQSFESGRQGIFKWLGEKPAGQGADVSFWLDMIMGSVDQFSLAELM